MPMASDLLGVDMIVSQDLAGAGELAVPDLVGVVLDPAGLREVLGNSCCRAGGYLSLRSNRMARELVVP
jgi:hypothetical protein